METIGGLYAVDEGVPGKPWLFFAHRLDFDAGVLLIKVHSSNDKANPSRRTFRQESILVSRLRLSSFEGQDIGWDSKLMLDYYTARVPARFLPLTFDACSEADRIRFLLGAANATRELNQNGVAYRNFTPAAFGRHRGGIVAYDFARATRMDTNWPHSLTSDFESFDPPEAQRGDYDVMRGEAFGMGHLILEAGVAKGPLGELAQSLMSPTPERRPTIEEAVAEIRRYSLH